MKKLLLALALIPTFICAQNTISGIFSPAEEFTYAFLYHATPTNSDYVNRAQLGVDGSFSIPLDSTATPGIYKIVYALPPEENNFDFIYNGKESVAFTFSLDTGLEFTDGQDNKLWASYTKSMDMVNRTISNFYTQESTDKKAYADIIKTLEDTQSAYETSAEGTLASVFIKANSPYIPQGFEDLSTYSKNLKRTYLEHVDFSNPLLQSSDFLVDRVLAYIFGMTANTTNDTYKKDVDDLMETIGEGQIEIKTILFEMIWRRFKSMNNPELANYVTDNYLLELSKKTSYDALTEQLITYKTNTIGNKATNFDLAVTKDGTTVTTTLHDLDSANQYLLIFWSSGCGHCLDELPKVKTMLADKKDIKVIAFGLEDEPDSWQTKITDYPDFIHVLGLGKWDNPTANAYGIESTPSYFILDKDKHIIAKPYDLEALEKALK
ncbi:TlpA family protein disulfide reductase [Psychroserpens algicola]|uniref:TlpA family protein disulfide reductase n=1 Tax=Psychroserpens algicola TaxID=1719034 RepID=UPI001954CAB1|nr:thioredoxin-like domain-containing protein [Psychroserpens algicola]